MKSGFCAIFGLIFFLAAGHAEPLINSELPSERVRDSGEFMSVAARAVLADYLDTLSQYQKTEFYVVILKDEPIAAAVKLCDRYQEQWIPKGQGGVFVYSAKDKKYAFTATPDTLNSVGPEKLQALFISAVENPPLRQSLDVVISTPILRIVTAIGQAQLEDNRQRTERAESQANRWQIIAGMAGAFAILGWLVCFSKFVKNNNLSTFQTNIPPPGMAYRNPSRRSRSGRGSSRRSREDGEGSGGGERSRGEEGSRPDRF